MHTMMRPALRRAVILSLAVALLAAVVALGGCGEKADPVETAKKEIGANFKDLATYYKATGEDHMDFVYEGQKYTIALFDGRDQQGLCFQEPNGKRVRKKVLEFDGEKVLITFSGIGRIQFDLYQE